MKVLMLRTQAGSPNGIKIETYKKGVEYNIPESLANVFIKIKAAEKAKITDVAEGIKQAKKPDEKKAVVPEYENKALKPEYEDKKNKKEK